MSYEDRTTTKTYNLGERVVEVTDVQRHHHDPLTGQTVNVRLMSRNVLMEGFTKEEEIEFIAMLDVQDYAGIQRRFG